MAVASNCDDGPGTSSVIVVTGPTPWLWPLRPFNSASFDAMIALFFHEMQASRLKPDRDYVLSKDHDLALSVD
ncbi:hypothetical protein CRG98_029021 [Punica granatum]|uniref:Uncharacterized protein n=1 Tax=Punica granatum TaxID=22663 RepID=A0A2I0J2X9_PUNGR|nr:hypothetical protein CRG98_029021 [Punica granatum]